MTLDYYFDLSTETVALVPPVARDYFVILQLGLRMHVWGEIQLNSAALQLSKVLVACDTDSAAGQIGFHAEVGDQILVGELVQLPNDLVDRTGHRMGSAHPAEPRLAMDARESHN
jgi:hypothetical protein